MSGGSFNYLCFADTLRELVDKRSELESMRSELRRLPYASEAYLDTEYVEVLLQLVERELDRLEPIRKVWKAVEWWRSSDWGEADVKAACLDYIKQRP